MNKYDDLLEKKNYRFDDLCRIMSILRGENGCPWDKEQTHRSIRKNFIEETYEVVEAIDNDDTALMREELGDVMLQVVFHSRISEEEGRFDINGVCDEVCKKLIKRHPHIFGNASGENSKQVLENWEAIKQKDKEVSRHSAIDGIPPSLPSLMKTAKAVKKSARAGVRCNTDEIMNDVFKTASMLENGFDKDLAVRMIFGLTACLQAEGFDAEELLYERCNDYINKFRQIEKNDELSETDIVSMLSATQRQTHRNG